MTEAERKLLLWCGMKMIRPHSLTDEEVKEIEGLLSAVLEKTSVSGIPAVAADPHAEEE